MITISKLPYIAPFSEIVNISHDTDIKPKVNLSLLGSLIFRQLRQLPVDFPEARIYNTQ